MPWITPFRPVDAGAAVARDNRLRNRVAAAVETASGQSLSLSRDTASILPPAPPAHDRRRGDRRREDRRQKQDAVILDTRATTDRRSGTDRRRDGQRVPARTRRIDDFA